MIRQNLKILIQIYFFLFINIKASFSQNEVNDSFRNLLNTSHFMEEIFKLDTVILKIPEKYAVGSVSAVHVTRNGNILIGDEKYSNLVLLFDHEGNFKYKIGENGKGPGEYLTPRHILSNSKDEIIISDPNLFRISYFDQKGKYLYSFNVKNKIIRGMLVGKNDEIIIHDQWLSRIKPQETIFIYSKNGRFLRKFGMTSKAYIKLRSFFISLPGPYLAIINDYLFETDYPDYHIRKFTMEGKNVGTYGEKPSKWRSLLSTDYQSLPHPKVADSASIKKVEKFLKNQFHKCSYVFWIQSLKSDILMMAIKYKNEKNFTKNFYFNFYNINGKILAKEIIFKNSFQSPNLLYNKILPAMPSDLCIIKMDSKEINLYQELPLIFLIPKISN